MFEAYRQGRSTISAPGVMSVLATPLSAIRGASELMQDPGRPRPHIAEPLNHRARLCQIEIENVGSALDGENAAAPRSFVPPLGSAKHDRLTGGHARHRVPDIH
jgi:hypothetical protein